MSQCTKEPCPHKPAIQEGITENPKKEEREKIGKKPTPRSTNKKKKTPRSPTHEPEESSSQNSTDHRRPRTHSPTSNKAPQSNTSPIRKLKPKRGRIPSKCHLIGRTVCTPCAKRRESPSPKNARRPSGAAASTGVVARTGHGRPGYRAGPQDTRTGTARPWRAVLSPWCPPNESGQSLAGGGPD